MSTAACEDDENSASYSSSVNSESRRSNQTQVQSEHRYQPDSYDSKQDTANFVQERSFSSSENVSISAGDVRTIFWKTGLNINRIEDDFNVNVTLNITVSGESPASIHEAVQFINEQLKRRIDKKCDKALNQQIATHVVGSDSNLPVETVGLLNESMPTIKTKNTEFWEQCPVMKSLYNESHEVTDLSKLKVALMRAENNIMVERLFANKSEVTDPLPKPVWDLKQCFSQYPDLMEAMRMQGLGKPSPVQSQAWPVLLCGEDMIAIVHGLSDKTLSFLIPAMVHVECQTIPRSERGGPTVLMLTPTREIAMQLEKTVGMYSFRGIRTVCLYKGENRRHQIENLKRIPDMLIATPGRLIDLVKANKVDLKYISFLVLQEADCMLGKDFVKLIATIVHNIRPDRQTVMTASVWKPEIVQLARTFMNNPIQVAVGSMAVYNVRHAVQVINDDEKLLRIEEFIRTMEPKERALIFCSQKSRAELLHENLQSSGFMCIHIQGFPDQTERDKTFASIASGEVNLLIGTTIELRGLELNNISYVINYDLPYDMKEYVHRLGHVSGHNGTCLSYFTSRDWAFAEELIEVLEELDQNVPNKLRVLAFQSTHKRSNDALRIGGKRFGGREKTISENRSKCKEANRIEALAEYPLTVKQFYKEAIEVASLSHAEVECIHKDCHIAVKRLCMIGNKSKTILNPVGELEHCFSEFPDLIEKIQKQGIEKPLPMQSQSWPILLDGEDMIGIGPEGVGKMLACILPAIIHVVCQPTSRSERDGPCVLILAPTGEMSLQLETEVNKYCIRGIHVSCLSVSEHKARQTELLKQKPDIIIATPDRTINHVEAAKLSTKYISLVILYEFNFEMHKVFADQISNIFTTIRSDRQTVVMASSLKASVNQQSKIFLKEAILVCVHMIDLVRELPSNHVIEVVQEGEKNMKVRCLIKSLKANEKAIIFCRKKKMVTQLNIDLKNDGFVCQCATKTQKKNLEKQAIDTILITTTLGFAGFSAENITHVINYDFPLKIEDYVQRMEIIKPPNHHGSYISFFTANNSALGFELIDVLMKIGQEVPKELWFVHNLFQGMKINENASNTQSDRIVTKLLYQEAEEVTKLSNEEVANIRKKNNITVNRLIKENDETSVQIPNPVWTFEQCFSKFPDIINEIHKKGFDKPSPFQSQAWPILLSGEDMIGIAPSDIDKILAFILPAFVHLDCQTILSTSRNCPSKLIIAPTDELALSLENVIKQFSFREMSTICVTESSKRLTLKKQDYDIVIVTLQTFYYLKNNSKIKFNNLTYVVLYEFDQMIHAIKERQINKFMHSLHNDAQIVLTVEELIPPIRQWAQIFMKNPIVVHTDLLIPLTVSNVRQVVEIMEQDERIFKIRDLVEALKPYDKMIIICRRRTRAKELFGDLSAKGVMCQCILESQCGIDMQDCIKILIVTDIEALMRNIEGVTYVINFDFPRKPKEYIARLGCISRVSHLCTYITYFKKSDWDSAQMLIDVFKETGQEVPSELREIAWRFKRMVKACSGNTENTDF